MDALADAPLLAGLDADARGALTAAGARRMLRSGETLYSAGDEATHVYLVLHGRLRVAAPDGDLIGYVGRHEPVGEMGVISGERRSATVTAVRDSAVLAIPHQEFLAFLHRQPQVLLALSRLAIDRLRRQGRARMAAATELQGTFAVIPASPDVPVVALAEALVHRLDGWPAARLITAAHVAAALGEQPDDARLSEWLATLERRHRYLILAADSDRDAWALRCLHNADRVLVLAEAGARPAPVPVLAELRSGGAPVELVLLRPEGDPSPHTLAWRQDTGARAHYFVHPWDEAELSSLARQVTGRGVGLVLGGGGARGFAHIGLVRALEQLRIPVDAIGGTSMGAFMSALLACGFDSVEMAQIVRETFVHNNYLNDYAVPRVSLIRGRKFAARLDEIFGDRQVEELRRTYFCVSTNLTTGASVVHDRGLLRDWVGTSMAVPGVAPPIAYEGELLCDGGVLDNLPTDVMENLERGAIVACNVTSDGTFGAPGAGIGAPDGEALLRRGAGAVATSPRLPEILVRTAMLTSSTTMEMAAERADVYVHMPSKGFGMFDWRRADALIELGYEHALAQLAPLRDTLVR